jgi:hypothetical protein
MFNRYRVLALRTNSEPKGADEHKRSLIFPSHELSALLKKTSFNLNETQTNSRIDLSCLRQKHTFHILNPSAYPFLVSFFLLTLLVPTTFFMHGLELPFDLPRSDIMHASFLGLYTTAMA